MDFMVCCAVELLQMCVSVVTVISGCGVVGPLCTCVLQCCAFRGCGRVFPGL